MNSILIIIVFAVILAGLLYYLQGREGKADVLPRAESEVSDDKKVVKVEDYQAQYEEEMEEESSEPEEQEAVEETPDEDISMLDGVGPKYQELLRAAGFETIRSIADSEPAELYDKLHATNDETEITKRPPTMSNVEDWVKASKDRVA